MKIINNVLILLIGGMFIFSCLEREEGFDYVDEGVALPVVNSVDQSFFNLLDLDNAYVEFELDANGDASSVEVLINFNGGEFVSYGSVSSFPTSLSISLNEAAELLDVTPADLVPGDNFGAIFRTSVGSSVFSSSTALSFPSACPSDIPEGTYTATQNDVSWFGTASTKTVTITPQGGGTYLISDVSAGGYEACCLAFGYNADQPALIRDVCNTLSIEGTGGSQISTGAGSVTGSYDPATNTLTVIYQDTFNGSPDLTSVFVKD